MKLQLDPNILYALALEGGGAKGSYQIGAWRALKEAGIRFSAVAGTSVGALNGALIVAGDLEKSEEIWENIRFSQVMDVDDETMSRLLRRDLKGLDLPAIMRRFGEIVRNGGLDVTPLHNLIRTAVSEEQIRAADTELYIVTFSLTDQKELELRARDLQPGELPDMLLASAYLPVFKNVKLGGKRYADGGLRDVLPLHVLIENGCHDIIALRLFGVGIERPVQIPEGTRVHTISPMRDLGSTLEFEPEQARVNMKAGYFDTMRYLYALKGQRYYIDEIWSEETAYRFLCEGIRSALPEDSAVTLRTLNEKWLPELDDRVNGGGSDYCELAIACLEAAAEAAGVSCWEIYTEDILREKAGARIEEVFRAVVRGEPLPHPEDEMRTGEQLLGRLMGKTQRLPARRGDGLRVCLLNDSFPPVIDGVANTVLNYARILSQTEDGCVVATPEYPGVHDEYPFPVVRYPSLDTTRRTGYRAGNPFSPAVAADLAAMDIDIIHTHCPVSSAMLARSLREMIHRPIVFTYHTKFDIDIQKAIRGELFQEAAVRALMANVAACDEVWVVSRGAGENLRQLGYKGEYVIMPNGVDLPRGRADEEMVQSLSRKWNLPAEVPVYLFIGRIMWYKGLKLILDGLRRVRNAGRDFRMVFVGDGTDRAEVETYARTIGLYDVCRFAGAEQDREIIRSWYSRADLLLFPSTFDTNGLVVREAAACSLGSLLIRGSCAAEGIEDGVTGLLAEESAESLASVLLRPGVDRAFLRRIGENARDSIYLSWEDSVNNARERYRTVLERWNSGMLPRRRAPFDGILEFNGDVAEFIGEARAQGQGALRQLMNELEIAKERLDRYL